MTDEATEPTIPGPRSMRAWAMRTSRDDERHRAFIRSELDVGRLRQGWGYLQEQDLREVRRLVDTSGWSVLTDDQKSAWGHWRMLGTAAAHSDDAMCPDDVVLVPNMPEDGSFVLVRVTGSYNYRIDPTLGDFGHVLPVENLTPSGVAYTNELVSSGLRRSLRCRSRLWWVGDHGDCLNAILSFAATGRAQDLASRSTPVARAHGTISDEVRKSLDALAQAVERPLRASLQSAEWESVLQSALAPLMRNVEVLHTGGPLEMGADLEIHIPNPFAPAEPWIVAVQLKDYEGLIGPEVAEQIEQAIRSRRGQGTSGTLVAIVLASTRAAPSGALLEKLDVLRKSYGIAISCVHGPNLMRVFARGLFVSYRDVPTV